MQCKTNDGYKCKRKVEVGSYCWQHVKSYKRCNSIRRKSISPRKPSKAKYPGGKR